MRHIACERDKCYCYVCPFVCLSVTSVICVTTAERKIPSA